MSDHIETSGKKKTWWKRWWAIALGILVVLMVIGALASSDEKQNAASVPAAAPPTTVTVVEPAETTAVEVAQTTGSQPEPETTTEVEAPAEPAPVEKPSFEGDGQFVVHEDIEPGTYRTREGSDGCYWARLKGFGGSLDEIAANANTSAPTVVTISRRDKGFEVSGCGTFTKDLSRITESKTRFGDGTFIVGTDIAPGRYRSTGGDGCYLARLRGFGGTLNEIVSNANPSGRAVVTIAASDKGFQSEGCGTWKRS